HLWQLSIKGFGCGWRVPAHEFPLRRALLSLIISQARAVSFQPAPYTAVCYANAKWLPQASADRYIFSIFSQSAIGAKNFFDLGQPIQMFAI
ncbi:MAG: hypothetical protein AAGU05_13740, partial [Anaerolineaceae bacterium]